MQKKIFLAVDTDQTAKAISMITPLQHELAGIKLGLEFFMGNGAAGVAAVMKEFSTPALPLFLDLKFHDIPNTVLAAVTAVMPLSPSLLTVHAMGGQGMVAAARQAIDDSKQKTKLLVVTMLTSLATEDLPQLSIAKHPTDYILSLATMAKNAGADGVVCSGEEAAMLRHHLGKDFLLVCPGIRLDKNNSGDQKRIMTPRAAIDAGANYLVMGRAISENLAPLQTLKTINHDIA